MGARRPRLLETRMERLYAMQVILRTSVIELIGTKVVGMVLEKIASRIVI